MPSAASRKCSECSSASSKYNCRNCHPITSTCSLACSKKHQSENHIQSKDKSKGKGKETSNAASTSTSFSSTSSLNPNPNSTSSYVPINSYDSDQFQKDFNYLNQVGRYVSDLGRDLLNKRMIPQEMLNNNSNSNSSGQSNNIVGAAQHKRETLRKQLHFRGLNVLLLPEGMEMRKKNGTNWLHKWVKMTATLDTLSRDWDHYLTEWLLSLLVRDERHFTEWFAGMYPSFDLDSRFFLLSPSCCLLFQRIENGLYSRAQVPSYFNNFYRCFRFKFYFYS